MPAASPSPLRRVAVRFKGSADPAWFGEDPGFAHATSSDLRPVILRGRGRILPLQPFLRELATLTGQPGAADDLTFFFSLPDSLHKDPVLILTRALPGEPAIFGIKAAVLLFEYRLLGCGLNLFSSADTTGRRTVLAQPHERASVAASASASLLARGALLVHLAFQPSHSTRQDSPWQGALPHGLDWACTRTSVPLFLQLEPTYDRTLERIGQRTRSNLRYYRRRAEREQGCRFIPQVNIGLPEFLAFNLQCMYAVPDKLAAWRFRSLAELGDPLFSGIQDRDGRWLALAGGRRRGREVELDWQMNRGDLPQLSLSLVLRAFLMEHEIARGSLRLYIEGGTPHPLGLSFTRCPVAELTVRRRSWQAGLALHLAARLLPTRNYIRQLLRDPTLPWHVR